MSAGDAALAELQRIGVHGWLIGGAVRDRLLGRETTDYDVSVPGSPEPAARELARRARGHAFRLSEEFGAWRVVARDGGWQVDLLPLAGTLEEDLAARDLTVNAIAEPVGGGERVDPFGGIDDLRRGVLRPVSRSAFTRDPLRTLRLVRLASELGLRPAQEALTLAAASASGLRATAGERVFAELRRIVVSERVLAGLGLMSHLGLTAQVLPELEALRGVEQNRFHHLDVHDHTLAVLGQVVELAADPGAVFGTAGPGVRAVLEEPLADELTRGQALRFGALFHDIAKPPTRGELADGRVTFIGHDEQGALLARDVLRRLRASARLAEHVAALTRHHLRLGFLVHQAPLDRHQQYGYLKATAPVEVDVTVLSVADRLATLGDGAEAAVARHLELAQAIMPAALEWRAGPPRPPLSGEELMAELDLAPGPALGAVLAALEEAGYAGEADSREAALELARRLAAGQTR